MRLSPVHGQLWLSNWHHQQAGEGRPVRSVFPDRIYWVLIQVASVFPFRILGVHCLNDTCKYLAEGEGLFHVGIPLSRSRVGISGRSGFELWANHELSSVVGRSLLCWVCLLGWPYGFPFSSARRRGVRSDCLVCRSFPCIPTWTPTLSVFHWASGRLAYLVWTCRSYAQEARASPRPQG